jgi:nucleoside-diphosphate-sugar epimerase
MFYDNTMGQIVNLGNPEEHTVREYAEMVKALTNSQSEIIHAEGLPQDDPLRRSPDIAKARGLLSWEPQVPLEEGLLKMISYIRKF